MENRRYKILLIEDDKLDQVAFMRMAEDKELPYDCTAASSLAEAKDILARKQFDIIIADYLLGDGTSLDILDSTKNIPFILVTGAGDEEIAVTAWRAGAYDYLIKDDERNYLKIVPITVENAIRHKRAEEKLRLLSHAIVSTDDSVYITDVDDKITFVNRAFCETYGYKEDEIIGKDCNILWKQNYAADDSENVFQAVNGWEVGFYHKRNDGGTFPVSLSRSTIKDENGSDIAVVVIARDISERMQVENEIRTLNQKLEKQNRLKSELATAVLEDLMSSLAVLQDTISGAKSDTADKTGAALRKNLELAEKDITRMERTVSNLYDMVKIDVSKTSLEPGNIKL